MFFDYVFYRAAKFFYRRDGASASRAVITVSTVQFFIPSAIIVFVQRTLYGGRAVTAKHSKVEAMCFTGLLIVVTVLNFFRYKDRYRVLRERWKGEAGVQKTMKGIGVICLILASWAS